jgi:hypothetical protein
MSAIDMEDEEVIREVTDARNLIAHELWSIVASDQMPDLDRLYSTMLALITKIENWWIINVEIELDPELAAKGVEESDVTSSSIVIMQILGRVALGDDKEAWELYREFVESH